MWWMKTSPCDPVVGTRASSVSDIVRTCPRLAITSFLEAVMS